VTSPVDIVLYRGGSSGRCCLMLVVGYQTRVYIGCCPGCLQEKKRALMLRYVHATLRRRTFNRLLLSTVDRLSSRCTTDIRSFPQVAFCGSLGEAPLSHITSLETFCRGCSNRKLECSAFSPLKCLICQNSNASV
jgi:hypothetical protein